MSELNRSHDFGIIITEKNSPNAAIKLSRAVKTHPVAFLSLQKDDRNLITSHLATMSRQYDILRNACLLHLSWFESGYRQYGLRSLDIWSRLLFLAQMSFRTLNFAVLDAAYEAGMSIEDFRQQMEKYEKDHKTE